MGSKVHNYEGEELTVHYNAKRCIHAAECVHGLPGVFDPKKRPWVEPDNADANAVEAVVMQCPTGALQLNRKDGGASELNPSENTVAVRANGPLYVRGKLELLDQDGTVSFKDMRVALCRCGRSQNKPFCDNSHLKEFVDRGELGVGGVKVGDKEGSLSVTPSENGPLLFSGPVTIVSANGNENRQGIGAALCRCGSSQNKPFCDGSHKKVGFISG